ncbi:MAG TPA: hypothetical protein VFJ90_04770, partial [Candidatus Didemnitutus sp.]|nr:hypothetical protein [Candidatus Didemnitutus sp.]
MRILRLFVAKLVEVFFPISSCLHTGFTVVGQSGGMENAQPPVIPTPAARRLAVFLKITCI